MKLCMRIGVAEIAKLLGVEPGAIRIWRNRGICRFGLDGARYAADYSRDDVLVMAWALALKKAGFELKEAFEIAEAHRATAVRYIANDLPQERYLIAYPGSTNAGAELDLAAHPISVVINMEWIARDLFGVGDR